MTAVTALALAIKHEAFTAPEIPLGHLSSALSHHTHAPGLCTRTPTQARTQAQRAERVDGGSWEMVPAAPWPKDGESGHQGGRPGNLLVCIPCGRGGTLCPSKRIRGGPCYVASASPVGRSTASKCAARHLAHSSTGRKCRLNTFVASAIKENPQEPWAFPEVPLIKLKALDGESRL